MKFVAYTRTSCIRCILCYDQKLNDHTPVLVVTVLRGTVRLAFQTVDYCLIPPTFVLTKYSFSSSKSTKLPLLYNICSSKAYAFTFSLYYGLHTPL